MRYNTLGIQVTNTCNMACPHCITDSSPSARGDLDWDEIERAIRSAASHVDGICVTGGEPLLKRELTFGIIRLTRELGLRSSMVTNGYWSRTRQTAERIMGELDAAGLDKLAVSYDQFHDRLVSPVSLEQLVQAGAATSMELQIQYCGARQDTAYHTARDVADRYDIELTTAEVLPFGRGRDLVAAPVTNDVDAVPNEPCGVVTRPVLTPEGELFTCCGPARDADSTSPLRLPAASGTEVGDALGSGETSSILNVIHNHGPRSLLDQLSEETRARVTENLRDTSMCSLCRAITDDREAVAELNASLASEQYRHVALAAVLRQTQDTLTTDTER
ncbi:radical SAM protein [Actinopolyspora mortivallis]|uniref:radical SAM protein n=1 Tax=Actinopolyspora mortivallis TaxID=33906 RepID=UPI00035D533E|nr:radical SAM protein [Actinopolyspora mortivallis]